MDIQEARRGPACQDPELRSGFAPDPLEAGDGATRIARARRRARRSPPHDPLVADGVSAASRFRVFCSRAISGQTPGSLGGDGDLAALSVSGGAATTAPTTPRITAAAVRDEVTVRGNLHETASRSITRGVADFTPATLRTAAAVVGAPSFSLTTAGVGVISA